METGSAPLLVEMFGQPGAGKSTVAHATDSSGLLTSASLSEAWGSRSRLSQGAIAARALVDPASLARGARLAAKVPLMSGDSLFRLGRLVVKSHWIRSQSGRMLLQEGFLQDLWSIFYSAGRFQPDPRLLSSFIASIYRGLDARIMFIEVDTETALIRIGGRRSGKSRLDGVPEPVLRRRLVDTGELTRRIAEAAEHAGLHVERLDGSAAPELLAERVRSTIAHG